MALQIEDLKRPPSGAMYVSPARICVTADDKITDENDPLAVRLLVAEGGELPAVEAAKYGLVAGMEPSAAEGSQESAEGAQGAAGEDTGTSGDETPLSRMRKDELVALAQGRGIEGAEDKTVAELRELLSAD